MKELELIEVDIEERKFRYNTDLTRFFALFAVFAATLAYYTSADIADKFLNFSILFFDTILIWAIFVSLIRIVNNRREILKLFEEKRKIINKLN